MQTNRNSTRRSLLVSATALILSIAMLVGTTFAWFTDTASTGVNKIQAGTLDIKLEMKENGKWVNAEGASLAWKKASGTPSGEATLWEPGVTYELPLLKITNSGNLETQFQVQINGITGTDKNAQPSTKLLDALDFEVLFVTNEVFLDGNYEDIVEACTTPIEGSSLNNLPYTIARPSESIEEGLTGIRLRASGEDGDTFYVRIRAHMDESANNDYQGLSLDNIGITVLATQCPAEHDSFNDQYDKDALYDGQLFKTSFSNSADAVKFCADCYNYLYNPAGHPELQEDHATHQTYLVVENGVAEVKQTGAWMDFGDLDWSKDYILSYDVDLSSLADGAFVAFDSGEQTTWQDLQIGFKNDKGTIKVYNTLTAPNENTNPLGTLNGSKAHLVYTYKMVDKGENNTPRYVINMNLEVSDSTNTYNMDKSTTDYSISPNTKLCWDVYTVTGESNIYTTLDNFLFEAK